MAPTPPSSSKPPRVEAVERALLILEAVGEGAGPVSLAELANRTGFYKSTLLRLAGSLQNRGYLVRHENGQFRLGPSLWALGSRYHQHFDLADCIRPELHRLVTVTKENASYFVVEGDMRVCLYRADSPHAVRQHLAEGARLPLAQGASGRVLQAFAEGSSTGKKMAKIRLHGSYCSLGERDALIAAVAVPVLDAKARLLGALAVSGLMTRFDEAARTAALIQLRRSATRLQAILPALQS